VCFVQAGCPSCRPTNSVKALKAQNLESKINIKSKLRENSVYGHYKCQPALAGTPVDMQTIFVAAVFCLAATF